MPRLIKSLDLWVHESRKWVKGRRAIHVLEMRGGRVEPYRNKKREKSCLYHPPRWKYSDWFSGHQWEKKRASQKNETHTHPIKGSRGKRKTETIPMAQATRQVKEPKRRNAEKEEQEKWLTCTYQNLPTKKKGAKKNRNQDQ